MSSTDAAPVDGPRPERAVRWGDLHNVRDLGGLPGSRGTTRFGRIFRSPRPDALDAGGWAAMSASGVRTLVDLRNDNEVSAAGVRPDVLRVLRLPIEDQGDPDFMAQWGERLGSPDYYPEALRRWPHLFASVFAAIGDAPDGAVLVHCGAGRDRTGLITAMLLTLVGVERGAILDDYEAGVRLTHEFLLTMDAPFEPVREPERFEEEVSANRLSLAGVLEDLDAEAYLLDAGVTGAQLDGIRSRLLD